MPEEAGLDTELTPANLRDRGLAEARAAARDQLSAAAGRYWVHLDVDVLDELAFPAPDYLMPGGLTVAELAQPPSRSSIRAVHGVRCTASTRAASSASRSTRSRLPPASRAQSSSVQPRRSSSANSAG